jgi:O-methyltransferase
MLNRILKRFGYDLVKTKYQTYNGKIVEDAIFEAIFQRCQPFTMTGKERMYALFKAVEYLAKNRVEGAYAECGVWRGGSSMLVALTLMHFGDHDRQLYLYDTYEGMSEPTENDLDFQGNTAKILLNGVEKSAEANVWCFADLDDVSQNMASTGYPLGNIHLIKGMVENTIPSQAPKDGIALLRLDTDWYESTKHELEYLYPALVSNGVLVIDDYGHWAGCRKAVDDYFQDRKILLNRIDYTGVIGIKTG